MFPQNQFLLVMNTLCITTFFFSSYHLSLFIHIFSEYPLSSNDVLVFRSSDQFPSLILCKLFKFLFYSLSPKDYIVHKYFNNQQTILYYFQIQVTISSTFSKSQFCQICVQSCILGSRCLI